MTDLPAIGARIKVWPAPGRNVQDGARTLDSGGRWLPAEGQEVIWDYHHLEQLRAGDLFFHDPSPGTPPAPDVYTPASDLPPFASKRKAE